MKRLICFFILISVLALYSISYSDNVNEPISGVSDIRENLLELSLEEKRILEELFLIKQKIKETEELVRITSLEINDLNLEIKSMESEIHKKQTEYNDNLNIMEDILKFYQRNGATTYLELILSSENLETLLRRINAIRDISRNTSNLLEELEITKKSLERDVEKLNETLKTLETIQNQLQQTIEKSVSLKNELEARLSSLQDDKAKFENYLTNLENTWVEIKPIFSETINSLVAMIEKGDLPEGTIVINLTVSGFKGIIREDFIKQILDKREFPTKVELLFLEDKIELILPEINLRMTGSLEILDDKQSLIFKMKEGEFLGMKLELSAMEELFSFGYLKFNFHKLLDKSTIKSVKIRDEYIELLINPVLF